MQRSHRLIVLLALGIFCAGDVALLEDTSFHSFLSGLGFFLVAILLYCFYLYRQTRYDIDRLIPFLAISLLISLSLIYLMYDGLNNLLIPVIAYMAIVLNFLKLAYLRYKNVNIRSYRLVFLGAAFFTIAQILIGLNRFYRPLPYKDVYIMFFYGFAQLMIIVGILVISYPDKKQQVEEIPLV
jgi:uncharacterized membrane protein YhhN